MELSEFWTICSANNVVLSKEQLNNIKRYAEELLLWNKKVNLISRKDEENIIEKHLLHSLAILKYINLKQKANCLDIGTGGGLPGIPLKIAREDIRMLLTDSIAKKIKISEMLAKHTGLRHISAKNIRAEELANINNYKKSFDCIFARAVSNIGTMIALSQPLLKNNGQIVLLKGGDLSEEKKQAEKLHPSFNIIVKDINIFGVDYFVKNEKKIVIINLK